MAILLLYLVFVRDTAVDISSIIPFSQNQTQENTQLATDVVAPDMVIYSNGAGAKTNSNNKTVLYGNLCTFFSVFTDQSSSMVTEISKDQMDWSTDQTVSMEFKFNYRIPFLQFCNAYGIQRASGFSNIENLTSIVLTNAAKDSILIKDEIAGKYYRIISENERDWAKEIIGSIKIVGDSAYPANQVLGVDSNVYIPISVTKKTESLPFSYEEYKEDSPELEMVAEAIFGGTLSFVRRISDSFGNITYMYGYGQKTLSIQADGTLEYKNTAVKSGESAGFFGDLQTALNFASMCGGFNNDDSHPVFVLSYAQVAGNDRNAKHTYYFTQSLDGEPIIGDDALAMRITVESGQVSSYLRHAIVSNKSYTIKEDVLQAPNAIAQISLETYKKYLNSIGGTAFINIEEGDAYVFTAQQVSNIKTCYKVENGYLVPSWFIEFKDGGRTWIGLKQKQS
ncbi:MAG: hypothetical protein MJ150_01405 [Clostridia bacterium]|nr:hypothetical protein [Clostridia bacterium]